MNGIDFASAQQKISEITKIVATVPDGLKEKAFELLFELAFRDAKPVEHPEGRGQSAEPAAEQRTDSAAATAATAHKLPGGVLGFLRRYTVQQEALEKLFMREQQPILPVYKIDNSVMAKGQLQKVMMILLENALLNNQFKASYKEVRDTCKEEGFYDGNFTQTLRKNSGLFKVGAISKDKIDEEGSVELSSEGFERLATTIKEVSHTTKEPSLPLRGSTPFLSSMQHSPGETNVRLLHRRAHHHRSRQIRGVPGQGCTDDRQLWRPLYHQSRQP